MVHSFLQAYLKDKPKIQPMVPKRHFIPDSIAEVESPWPWNLCRAETARNKTQTRSYVLGGPNFQLEGWQVTTPQSKPHSFDLSLLKERHTMPAGKTGRELLIKGPQGPKKGLSCEKGHSGSSTTTVFASSLQQGRALTHQTISLQR